MWLGPDAVTFKAEWRSNGAQQVRTIVDDLREQSMRLRVQADQQRTASELGGPGGPGGPGNPTGGGGGDQRWAYDATWGPPGLFRASGEGGTYSGRWSKGESEFELSPLYAAGKAEGEVAVGVGAYGEHNVNALGGAVDSKTEYKAQAGAGLEGEADFKLRPSGFEGKAEGKAWAGARAEFKNETNLLWGAAKNEFAAGALAGARAGAEANLEGRPRRRHSRRQGGSVRRRRGEDHEQDDGPVRPHRRGADIGAALGVGFDVSRRPSAVVSGRRSTSPEGGDR